MKDKWKTKSIYVVGKATAALGQLCPCLKQPLPNCPFFVFCFTMFMLIVSECGRHLVLAGKCQMMVQGCSQLAVMQVQHKPDACHLCDLFVASFDDESLICSALA